MEVIRDFGGSSIFQNQNLMNIKYEESITANFHTSISRSF